MGTGCSKSENQVRKSNEVSQPFPLPDLTEPITPSTTPLPGLSSPRKTRKPPLFELHQNLSLQNDINELVEQVQQIKFNEDLILRYCSGTKRGFYPREPYKKNQDSYITINPQNFKEQFAFFGVFDGHGLSGEYCSQFVRDTLPGQIMSSLDRLKHSTHFGDLRPELAIAHKCTAQLLKSRKKDKSSESGTTSISILIDGQDLFVCNVGDSRAVLATRTLTQTDTKTKLIAEPLSFDQTPFRADERKRVIECGARVLSSRQISGDVPMDAKIDWDRDENEGGSVCFDPPRIWSPKGDFPGAAFTRSIGDFDSESIGITSDPEILQRAISPKDKFIVIASDGVFEFLSSQEVVDLVAGFESPADACRAVIDQSYSKWMRHDIRSDDITVIVIMLDHLDVAQMPSPPSPSSLPSTSPPTAHFASSPTPYLSSGNETSTLNVDPNSNTNTTQDKEGETITRNNVGQDENSLQSSVFCFVPNLLSTYLSIS